MDKKDPTIHISNEADLKLANLKLMAQSRGMRIFKERIADWIILNCPESYKDFEKKFFEWAKNQARKV